MQLVIVLLLLCVLTVPGCETNEPADTKDIFERAAKSDSLSYYFPSVLNDTIKARNPNYKDFKQNWYSSLLYSFKEPILYTKNDSQLIYQLLWLRSFHQPVCFSMKEYKGAYFLNTKKLDRQPAFYPTIESRYTAGKKLVFDTLQKADRLALVDFDSIKALTGDQWKEIEHYMSAADFWNSPVADPYDEGSTDGSNWIIEGRKNGKYHFIDRRNADGDLMPFGKYLITLSGLKIEKDAIY